ncbi:MAG: CCA tRNA nucleotidyltransferase [Dehalococcoidia bacterium]|nr:CCA tRNA nucleotidyltransferase [Dehalococcoidia bacterium]
MLDNIADRITNDLPAMVGDLILTTGKTAIEAGYKPYLVGGIVRDLIIGRPGKDIDIMIEGNALTVAGSMAEILGSRPTIHKRFGTATFKLDSYRIDLAGCRSETYAHPGALPTVASGSIEEDLLRRDFTVNAMAACISPDHFGDLTDLYGGRQDLSNKLIRVLHEKSFRDDATRIMRAVRYEQRLDFHMERKTARLLRRDLDMLDTISSDRLRHEVILWLGEPHAGKIFRRAARLGVLAKLSPALSWGRVLAKAFRNADAECGGQSPVHLHFALLVCNLDKEHLNELLRRLNIRGGQLEEIARHTAALQSNQVLFDHSLLQPSETYFRLIGFNYTAVYANYLLAPSAIIRKNLKLYLDKLHMVKTRSNGESLAALGVPRGRQMGIILEKILAARLDGKVKTRSDEERMAIELLRNLETERM